MGTPILAASKHTIQIFPKDRPHVVTPVDHAAGQEAEREMATLTAIQDRFATTPNISACSPTVAELVRAAQAGDRRAAGELFERYKNMVLSVAFRRLGDYTEAQELLQEVFVQALQKLDQLRTPECFGSWLRSITVRMAINRMVRGDRAGHDRTSDARGHDYVNRNAR